MSAVAQLVEDEEHVADVQCNATLQVIVEVDVTAQRLPVAVESSTDELSFAIDDGAARVAAGDVVRREEANRHGAVCHGVASEVFLLNQFFQLGGYYEFTVFGILFFKDTVGSGIVVVVYSIARAV